MGEYYGLIMKNEVNGGRVSASILINKEALRCEGLSG
jgi:hypothetical protein